MAPRKAVHKPEAQFLCACTHKSTPKGASVALLRREHDFRLRRLGLGGAYRGADPAQWRLQHPAAAARGLWGRSQ